MFYVLFMLPSLIHSLSFIYSLLPYPPFVHYSFTHSFHYASLLQYTLLYFILYSYFSNFTFFIPILSDFFLIFPIFFFKGLINGIEVITGFNPCYSILFINFYGLFFQIQ